MIYAAAYGRKGYHSIFEPKAQIYHTAVCRISYCEAIYHIFVRKYIIITITALYYLLAALEEMMTDNKLLDLSFEFSVLIVKIVDDITVPKSSFMVNQLARSGTSVGANIHEAQYAQSKNDFVSKLEIALKESNETSYWLRLLKQTGRIDDTTYTTAEKLCGNIRRLLIASCKTVKVKK